MLQEVNLREALEKVQRGDVVLAATGKSNKDSLKYTFRPLNEILSRFIFLADMPTVEKADPEESVKELPQTFEKPEECREEEELTEEPETTAKERGYVGFLHIRCKCGAARSFCTRDKITVYECGSCGRYTELNDLKLAFINCECGRKSRYFTNETAEIIEMNCINCGQPVDLKYNKKKGLYETIR